MVTVVFGAGTTVGTTKVCTPIVRVVGMRSIVTEPAPTGGMRLRNESTVVYVTVTVASVTERVARSANAKWKSPLDRGSAPGNRHDVKPKYGAQELFPVDPSRLAGQTSMPEAETSTR